MANDDGATGEGFEAIFERSQCVDVEVIGGFVEEQYVAAASQHLGEVNAVSFATGKDADLFLLVRSLEVERGNISPSVHLSIAEFDDLVAVGDFFVDGFLGVEDVATLIDIREVYGWPNSE